MPIRSLDVLLHSGGGLDPGIALLPSFLKTSTLVIACLKENVETVLLFFNGEWIGIPIGCWAGKNSFTDTKMNIRVDSTLPLEPYQKGNSCLQSIIRGRN